MQQEADLRAPIPVLRKQIIDGQELFIPDQVPVQPLTDIRLASWSHAQRVEFINDRLPSYLQPVLEKEHPEIFKPHEPSELSRKPFRPESLRLSLIMYEYKAREFAIQHATKKEAKIQETYDIAKAELNSSGIKDQAKASRLKALQEKWFGPRDITRAEKEAAEVLRDTLADIFIKDFFLTPDRLSSLPIAIGDLAANGVFTEDEIRNLLQNASRRLNKAEAELAGFFVYKDNSDNLYTEKKAAVLTQLVESVFKNKDSSQFGTEISEIAEGILDYYWRNRDKLFKDEEVPTFAFTYDYLFAAGLIKDQELFLRSADWILVRLRPGKLEKLFFDEIDRSAEEMRGEADAFYEEIVRTHGELADGRDLVEEIQDPSDKLLEEIFKSHEDRYIVGKNYERISSFLILGEFLGRKGRRNLLRAYLKEKSGVDIFATATNDNSAKRKAKTSGRVNKLLTTNPVFLLAADSGDPKWEGVNVVQHHMDGFRPDMLTLDKLLTDMMDRELFYNYKSTRAPGVDLTQRDAYVSMLQEPVAGATSTEAEKVAQANTAIHAIMTGTRLLSEENLPGLERENRILADHIRDQNLWFVATNSDRFAVEHNEELTEYGINSLTFYPDPDSHGGHKVVIATNFTDSKDSSINLEFVIDRDGNLHYPSGYKVEIPVWLLTPFSNLLLKRLHFITGGYLKSDAQIEVSLDGGEGLEEPEMPLTRRRHHYRVLTSTPSRTFTLRSHEARLHADWVLKTYGIDIYSEIIRRRQAKTLGDNQVVTFVKEVTDDTSFPNQLKYEEIPIYKS